MKLTELRYAVTLAREKHFGHAAEKCFVSQPTLSIAIKKLEDEFGVAIFERNKHNILVTPQGERIIAQAERVLAETGVLEDIARAGDSQLNGLLRVGAIYTIGPYLFPHLIPQVKQLAPDMPLFIEENYTAVLRQKLLSGELDVIIISLPFTGQDILTQPLYDEPFVFLLPCEHALAKQDELSSDALPDEQLLLLGEGHCFRDQVMDACPHIRQGIDTNDNLEGSSLETLRHMVASGLGISVLPQSAAGEQQYAEGALTTRPFSTPAPYRTVALAWRTSFTRPQVIDVLNQASRACHIRL